MQIRLERPSIKYANQIMDYKNEMLANGDSFDGCDGLEYVETYENWPDFDGRLRRQYGYEYVPSETFLAISEDDDKVVGIIDFRHPLTEFLLNYGGNIGGSILPSARCKGYATQMLSLLLPICKEAGEKKVLLTCNKNNAASRSVIMKCGGILENEINDEFGFCGGGIIQRFWIELT